MERAMKVEEVILRAIAGTITWWQAAEIIGISDRQMRRWRQRYEEFGVRSLYDRRRGKPSPKRVALAEVEQVLQLYREKYFDLNVRHFHEKLAAEHQVTLSYSWVKGLLQGAGLVAKGRKRGAHRKRRPRRPLPGRLLHMDGSRHRWFQDERWCDLIVVLDDASSQIYYAQLVEEESTATVMAALWEVIGPQELQLHGITTLEAANGFLREHYIAEFNGRFQVAPAQRGNAFMACRRKDLDLVFALKYERTVNRDNTVSFQNLSLQIERVRWRATLAGCNVTVHQHLDGTLSLTYGPHRLGRYSAQGVALSAAPKTMEAAVEKTPGGKVPKPTFPPGLEIPPTARDSHFPTATTATGI